MATFTYPSAAEFVPSRFDFGIRAAVIVNVSRFTGAVERLEMPGSRWIASLSYPVLAIGGNAAGEREAFWSKIRGQANVVSMWHLVRPIPRGTMRGSPIISTAVAQGATVLPITTTAGATLLAGDMIGAGGMLFQVVTSATASGGGAVSVSVSPPARVGIVQGAAVTWDKPSVTWMITEGDVRVPYEPAFQREFSVDLVEVW
jgi:hypothetical protein